MSTFRWATVTATVPLRIRLDGDSAPLDITPESLVAVTIGDRVRVERDGRQTIVHGVAV